MKKLAQIRDQEVRGTLAALVDSGFIKCASCQEFDQLSEKVAGAVGYDYDMADVVSAADAVINGQVKTASMTKCAAEEFESDCYSALGELLLMKTAGQIDDAYFAEEADGVMKLAAQVTGICQATEGLPGEVRDLVFRAIANA